MNTRFVLALMLVALTATAMAPTASAESSLCQDPIDANCEVWDDCAYVSDGKCYGGHKYCPFYTFGSCWGL